MPNLIGPGDIIAKAWENFRANIREYAEFALWIVLLSVVQWAIQVVLKTTIPDRYMRLAMSVLLSIPASLVVVVVGIGTMDFAARTLNRKKATVRDSLMVGFHKLISFIWISFLVSVAVGFGMLLALIPGIIFFVWYKFTAYHLVVDDVKGTAAMRASRELVRGRWWPVLFRIAVPTLFFVMGSAFVKAVAMLIIGATLGDPRMFFGTVANPDQLSNTHTLITSIVPQTIEGLTAVLLIAADVVLWNDLKKRS